MVLSRLLVFVSPMVAQRLCLAGAVPAPTTSGTSTISPTAPGTSSAAPTTPVYPNQAAPATASLPAQKDCSSDLRSGGTSCPNALQPPHNPQVTSSITKSTV